MVIHFDDASFAHGTVVRSFGFEGVASPAEPSSLSRFVFLHERRIFFLLHEQILHIFQGCRVRGNGPGIGRHGLEMGNRRQRGNQCKAHPVQVSHHAYGSNPVLVDAGHPGRNQNQTHRVDSVNVQHVRQPGTKQSAAVQIEPVLVKGAGSVFAPLDLGLLDDGRSECPVGQAIGWRIAAAAAAAVVVVVVVCYGGVGDGTSHVRKGREFSALGGHSAFSLPGCLRSHCCVICCLFVVCLLCLLYKLGIDSMCRMIIIV
mmetsp:Transcript_4946/g.11797  ORF Transcript_4946/g.11797 Transcript_4946/m.11797 type:complete len:259 (-) Transcript_4946:88-864(-)